MYGIHLTNISVTNLKMFNVDYFTKRVTSLKNYSYPERLSILGLEQPELRRLRCDLIQYYKIFNSLTSLNPAEYFTVHQPPLSSRASSSILIRPFKRPNYV